MILLKEVFSFYIKLALVIIPTSSDLSDTNIAYPTIMSQGSLPIKEQLELGINKWFFRLSLGLEDSKDIISSFEKALEELN